MTLLECSRHTTERQRRVLHHQAHQHFPLPNLTPAFSALDSVFFPFEDLASLLALHTFFLHWTLPLCQKKTSADRLSPETSPWTLLQTSTIILSFLRCLFLRVAYTHCFSSMPKLCLTLNNSNNKSLESLKMVSDPSILLAALPAPACKDLLGTLVGIS